LAEPTLGAANSDVRISDVVISEIHHNPIDPDGPDRLRSEDFQFVELYNRTEAPVDLTDWRLSGSVQFEIPLGTHIPPKQAALVVPFGPTDTTEQAVFRFQYGAGSSAPLLGPFDGELPADRGVLRLERPLPTSGTSPRDQVFVVVDEVEYRSMLPWPASNSAGMSLNRVPLSGFGRLPENWRRAPPSPASVAEPRPVIGDSNGDGLFDPLDIVQVLRTGKYLTGLPATASQGDWNQDGWFDQLDLAFALQADTYLK
jgi:hypothetical protein